MRIGIDCRLAGIEHAGIGRYIEELVREVTKDKNIEWVLFVQKAHQLPWLMKSSHVTQVIADVRHYTLHEQLVMPGIFGAAHLDLLHVPHFNIPLLYRGKMIVTIHDLLWHDQRGQNMTTLSPWLYAIKYQAYRFVVSQAIARSKRVLVPAHTVKQAILSHVPHTKSEKIVVTYEGVDAKWFTPYPIPPHAGEGALFYTGSLYPHKNVMLVVRALKLLPGVELHISSSRNVFVDAFMQEVKFQGLSERVKHLGRLSDDELRLQYQKSLALVQPSFSEGFGLTGIEAMAVGLPVLASDIPIFREIYSDAFIPFDPKHEASFATAVKKLETSFRRVLVQKGFARARRYSWRKMGRETLNVYKQYDK